MGVIEQLTAQDTHRLREDCVIAYTELRKLVCHCPYCTETLSIDARTWHPEKKDNYNDAFKIVSLLEHFGYPRYDWDGVLYTFYLKADEISIEMHGLSLQQAICNTLVMFYVKSRE